MSHDDSTLIIEGPIIIARSKDPNNEEFNDLV